MKFNIKKAFPIVGLAMTLGMSSCVNDLNVEPIDPRLNTQVNADKLFNKMYAEFVFEGKGPGESELDLGDPGLSVLYRLLWNANELTTDEAICGWTDHGTGEFSKNSFTAANESLYGLWWRLNFGVSICNQYLKECADYDKTMTAEAHFMRDLYYYYLLDNFGNPSFSETMPDPDPKQIKSADLYNFIVKDLEENMGNMLPPSVRKNCWPDSISMPRNTPARLSGPRLRNMPRRSSRSRAVHFGRATMPLLTAVPTTSILPTRCSLWPTTTRRVLTTSASSASPSMAPRLPLGVPLPSCMDLPGMQTWRPTIRKSLRRLGAVTARV